MKNKPSDTARPNNYYDQRTNGTDWKLTDSLVLMSTKIHIEYIQFIQLKITLLLHNCHTSKCDLKY